VTVPSPALRVAAALTTAALVTGCAPDPPDYQSVWANGTTTTTVAPVPIAEYLKNIGVTGKPAAPDTLPDLKVSIPTPEGWSRSDNPNLPPDSVTIHKGEAYPTAMLTAIGLEGDFQPAEVIRHSFADVQLVPTFKRLDGSDADFHGFPSAMLQGSYTDSSGQRLQSYMRAVIATGSAPEHQRYLVQLTIVSAAGEAATHAGDVEAIIGGFTVAAK
jgi:hypothetical protein